MTLLQREELVFAPLYKYLSVRDYTLSDQQGLSDAVTVARNEVVASNGVEVVVVCAQDVLKARIVLELYDGALPRLNLEQWQDRLCFELPFPSGQLRMGDGFDTAKYVHLPHAGTYAVDVVYRGRKKAADQARAAIVEASSMPTMEGMQWLEQWAGLEEYCILVGAVS